MFHVAQWGSYTGNSPLESFPLWAHLKGVPFDLMTQERLSLIAGLVGKPKERDDYTINLVSLSVAHVKVEANLTKQLPEVVEVEREDGSVANVYVEYPWLPPTCSHCHQIGHIIRYCPKATREWIPKAAKAPPDQTSVFGNPNTNTGAPTIEMGLNADEKMDCTSSHIDCTEVISADLGLGQASVTDGLVFNQVMPGSNNLVSVVDLTTSSHMSLDSHPGLNSPIQSTVLLAIAEDCNTSHEPISPTLINCIISLPASGTSQATLAISPVKRSTPFKPLIPSYKKPPLPSPSATHPSGDIPSKQESFTYSNLPLFHGSNYHKPFLALNTIPAEGSLLLEKSFSLNL